MTLSTSIFDITRELGEAEAAGIKRLLAGDVKIPPQPRVLEELRQQVERKELDVRRLARIIEQDPGLLALLFKVVASPTYRQHQPFENAEQILHAVGVRQTINLVRAIALASTGTIGRNRLAYETFWSRSQRVGQLAMLIADERVAVCNIFPDQAYLAGIFHDCGVPLLMQRFTTYCREMRLSASHDWIDLAEEDRRFSADHCVVGYLVARHWNLPGFICDAIRYHHALGELGDLDARSMVAILQLAIDIHYRDLQTANPEWERVKAAVIPELGLGEDSLPEFVDIILERFHGAGD